MASAVICAAVDRRGPFARGVLHSREHASNLEAKMPNFSWPADGQAPFDGASPEAAWMSGMKASGRAIIQNSGCSSLKACCGRRGYLAPTPMRGSPAYGTIGPPKRSPGGDAVRAIRKKAGDEVQWAWNGDCGQLAAVKERNRLAMRRAL